jgi:hypothetical protein
VVLSGFGCVWVCLGGCGWVWVGLGGFLGCNVANFELFWMLNGLLNWLLSGF